MRSGRVTRPVAHCRVDPGHVAHPVFEKCLHLQPADDPASHDRHGQAEAEVERCNPPTEEAEQQRERHLVDHRCGDEERKRHAERHSRLDESDEERHRRARAERRDHAETRRHHIGGSLGAAGEEGSRALGGEVGIHHPHHEDDAGEQQQDLGSVVEEELQRSAQVTGAIHGERRHQRFGGRGQGEVEGQPGQGRDRQELPGMGVRPLSGRRGQVGGHDEARFATATTAAFPTRSATARLRISACSVPPAGSSWPSGLPVIEADRAKVRRPAAKKSRFSGRGDATGAPAAARRRRPMRDAETVG